MKSEEKLIDIDLANRFLDPLNELILDKYFLEQAFSAANTTKTPISGSKIFRRFEKAKYLLKYYLQVKKLEGYVVEAGVYRGFSAKLLAEYSVEDPRFLLGANFFLIDSYEGLSEPSIEDLEGLSETKKNNPIYQKGYFATSLSEVKNNLKEFSEINYIKGYIPEVYDGLVFAKSIKFLHIDVDLFEPTLETLRFFWDKICPGGVIVNDDYGSSNYQGSSKAWDLFFSGFNYPYCYVLPSGQSIAFKL